LYYRPLNYFNNFSIGNIFCGTRILLRTQALLFVHCDCCFSYGRSLQGTYIDTSEQFLLRNRILFKRGRGRFSRVQNVHTISPSCQMYDIDVRGTRLHVLPAMILKKVRSCFFWSVSPCCLNYHNHCLEEFAASILEVRQPLWSSSHSSWLQILRSGLDSRRCQIF
jgi:hypothetical protein